MFLAVFGSAMIELGT